MRFLISIAVLSTVLMPALAEDSANCPMKDQPCTYVVLNPSGWLEVGETIVTLASAAKELKTYVTTTRLFLVPTFHPIAVCSSIPHQHYMRRSDVLCYSPGLDNPSRSKPWTPKSATTQCSSLISGRTSNKSLLGPHVRSCNPHRCAPVSSTLERSMAPSPELDDT